MAWTLNNIGSIQDGIKQLNFKIDNIIETITGLEQRISAVEKDSKQKDLKSDVDKKAVNRQEENPPIV